MYLISFRFDDREHLKGFSLSKGVVIDTFLSSQISIYHTVHDHLPRVEVESKIIIAGLPSLEIDLKSVRKLKY